MGLRAGKRCGRAGCACAGLLLVCVSLLLLVWTFLPVLPELVGNCQGDRKGRQVQCHPFRENSQTLSRLLPQVKESRLFWYTTIKPGVLESDHLLKDTRE